MYFELQGRTLNSRYLITHYWGNNGSTHIFNAQHITNGSRVVVELMEASKPIHEQSADTLLNSLQTLIALDHPNIAKIYDFGVYEQMLYVVREDIPGKLLQAVIDENNQKPIRKEIGINIIYQIGHALAYAEKFSLSHGSLTPRNILIHETGRVVVTNLGVVQLLDRYRGKSTNYIQNDVRALGNLFDKLLLMTDVSEDVERTIYRILGFSGVPYTSYQELLVDLEYLRSNVQTTMLAMDTADLDDLASDEFVGHVEEEKSLALVTIYFPDIGHVQSIFEPGEYSVGRRFQGQPLIPDIDLTEFNAYLWGISKMHANIRVDIQGGVKIMDMGSSNGTFINGKKIAPGTEHPINSQDMYQIGRMRVQFVNGSMKL